MATTSEEKCKEIAKSIRDAHYEFSAIYSSGAERKEKCISEDLKELVEIIKDEIKRELND